jgi:HEAT repeat protein/cyclophilin family peptidyl-prolyl cis-trans isomerase
MVLASAAGVLLTAQAKRPLAEGEIGAIANLVMLEDTRNFDEAVLSSLLQSQHPEVRRRAIIAVGRIIGQPPPPQPTSPVPPPRGSALLAGMRTERDPEMLATVAWATGQLRDPANVPWLAHLLTDSQTPAVAAKEAAGALGKIASPDARVALANYLTAAPATPAAAPVVGEALLAIGRRGRGDLTPVLRWTTSASVEVRWRAAWALFRLRDPSAFSDLLKLADDPSGEVRYWAVRGLAPIPPPGQRGRAGAAEPPPPVDPPPDPALMARMSARLRAALKDPDRRVRIESLRALGAYDDDESFAAVLAMLDSPDTWLSVTAAEVVGTKAARAEVVAPKLAAAAAATRPLALRHTALAPLVTMAPDRALDIAAELARSKSVAVRLAAVQALGRLGEPGRAKLAALEAEPGMRDLLPPPAGGPQAPRPTAPVRTLADYRKIVERWVVPDYNGAAKPRSIWTFSRGEIEIELFPGDAPLATEYFVTLVESGAIIGTEFGRLVPNFVAQQRTITGAFTLRDEVNRRGLTRANLSWASAGLDTGRPGYTLGNTPQPHNEGNFTSLGRVVRGMEVVDRLELGDAVTATRMRK